MARMRLTSFVAIGFSLAGTVLFSSWVHADSVRNDVPPPNFKKIYAQPSSMWPAPFLKKEVTDYIELGALKKQPPQDTVERQKAKLGKLLFEDPVLSASSQISCQSCHNQELAWGDGLRTSFGHDRKKGKRNAPSLFSASYRKTLFWDGRAKDLPSQAMGPLTASDEMANQNINTLVSKLAENPDYVAQFRKIYRSDQPIQLQWILDSLRAFQTTLEKTTRFDRFLTGDLKQMTEEELHGLHIFRTKAGCANCHHGPLLTDEKFHNIGLSYYGRKFEDLGRYHVTGDPLDAGKFRTPSLRHVKKTGPYMHNGLFPSIIGVVNIYAAGGGRVSPNRRKGVDDMIFEGASTTSPLITEFKLSRKERAALVAFLSAL